LPEPARGMEACKKLIIITANTFSEFKGSIEEVNIKGDWIWSRFSMSGINSGPLGQIPATEKKFQITGMAITRIEDGKIIEDETYWNVWDFYKQLGFELVPPKAESES
jgi:predicted ester cyclase